MTSNGDMVKLSESAIKVYLDIKANKTFLQDERPQQYNYRQ